MLFKSKSVSVKKDEIIELKEGNKEKIANCRSKKQVLLSFPTYFVEL